MTYHDTVLLDACIQHLHIQPHGIYVDATFGGGGHSRAILDQLGPEGKLFGFDQDPDTSKNAPNDDRFQLLPFNFEHITRILRLHKVTAVDGILADLGVSSHQLDEGSRGFSFRQHAELDMRMNPQSGPGAREWLETVTWEQLAQTLREFGDVHQAGRVATAIIQARDAGQMTWTEDLYECLQPMCKGPRGKKLPAQVFQAIRIAVNRELAVLDSLLVDGANLLKTGGRYVVMSYHSLEDRRVKRFFKEGVLEGEAARDDHGRRYEIFDRITRKPLVASQEEIAINPRARSAKLRVVEKIEPTWG
jgi:16S rRNA (cytosine1402-N4)-methyltransferase